jgi:hypothetical protein
VLQIDDRFLLNWEPKIRTSTPVFCDNCSNLALAEFDGAPLCAECLLYAVKTGGIAQASHNNIAPLGTERSTYLPFPLMPPVQSVPEKFAKPEVLGPVAAECQSSLKSEKTHDMTDLSKSST